MQSQIKFPIRFLLVLISLVPTLLSAQESVEIGTRTGLFGSKFTVNVPMNENGSAPSVIVVRNGDEKSQSLFFATGLAATNLSQRSVPQTAQIQKNPMLAFYDLRLIQDGSGQNIAAAYPIFQNRNIFLTALHTLQNTRFQYELSTQQKRWGLQDPETGRLLDIAIISEIESANELKTTLLSMVDTNEMASGYVDHLNQVDANGELILSRSLIHVTSANQNYIFFNNSAQAMIGYASSGALIYNDKSNKAHSLIVCASRVTLNQNETVIRNRALKLNTIKYFNLIELTDEIINGFEKLPCDPQNGRGAGGP